MEMDQRLIWKYERAKLQRGYDIEITARGTSMAPFIIDGESVLVRAKEDYQVGEVLLFFYKDTDVLLHRLVKKEQGSLYCKGDNSYRLEKIGLADVLGSAVWKMEQDQLRPLICPAGLPEASLMIHRLLIQLNYDRDLLMESQAYQNYFKKYLSGEK